MATKKSRVSNKRKEVRVKDLKPRKDPKGGVLIGLLLPAVQKVREAG